MIAYKCGNLKVWNEKMIEEHLKENPNAVFKKVFTFYLAHTKSNELQILLDFFKTKGIEYEFDAYSGSVDIEVEK